MFYKKTTAGDIADLWTALFISH